MEQTETNSTKLQWKWVGIAFLCYLFLYVIPLTIAEKFLGGTAVNTFVGIWVFGGIFIISGAVGRISKGVTILEPFLASVFMVVILFCIGALFDPFFLSKIPRAGFSTPLMVITIFIVSLIGAWIGEAGQKYREKKREEASK